MNHMTPFRVAVTKIAKKYEISMTRVTEKVIEFYEVDQDKISEFRYEIGKLNDRTMLRELISCNEHIDINKFDIRQSKAKYLVDDDYYNEIIGLGKMEQLAMF